MTSIFARNFDYDTEDGSFDGPDTDRMPEPTMTLAEARLMADQARNEGFEDGQIAGTNKALAEERASREARSDEALAVLSAGLADLDRRDRHLRTEVELEVAELIMGIGERLLPDLFEAHMADLLLARIRAGLRMVSGTGQVVIRVPPELKDALSHRIAALVAQLDTTTTQYETVADPQVDDGTIRIEWRNGFMTYDPALAGVEALETLREAIIELRSQLENMP